MFKSSSYDVLEFAMPTKGMNQNISPDLLNPTQAYLLENIIPLPLGEGKVRYGTKLLPNLNLPVDATIQKVFDYTKTDGTGEYLLYVQEFKKDESVNNATVLNGSQIRFNTTIPNKYIVGTPCKITYSKDGVQTVYSDILKAENNQNIVTITLVDNFFPSPFDGTVIDLHYPTGKIYKYDFTEAEILKKNLAVNSVPRAVFFKNHLLICNGVDNILSWDGETLKEVEDYIKEGANTFARTDDTSFTFTAIANFNPNKYNQGDKIKLKVDGTYYELTVTHLEQNNLNVTLTTPETLPQFTAQNRVELYYRDTPPPFSYLFVAHNRLFALGKGAVSLKYREEPMTVYYAYRKENITNWFDEKTKLVPSLDISYKHGKPDNLEAIAVVGGYLGFIGRERTQIWEGLNPDKVSSFRWRNTIEGGIAQGDLLLSIANDAFVVTPQGTMTFSTLNEAKQVALASIKDVDPLIRKYVKELLSNEKTYRQASAFYYPEGAFAGFKIGENETLIAITDTGLNGWTTFTGDFKRATAFNTGLKHLVLAIGNKLYQYQDGKEEAPTYEDSNNNPINFTWTLPRLSLKNGKRFANKRYSVEMDYTSSLVVNSRNHVELLVYGDLRRTFDLTSAYPLYYKGDVLGDIPLSQVEDENERGLRLNEPYSYPKAGVSLCLEPFG